jgi:phage-related minor tail protein
MADTVTRAYQITVDAAAALAQLAKFQKGTEESTKSLQEMGDKLIETGKHLAEVWVMDKALEAFQHTIEALDDTAKAAQRVGVAAEQLQMLRYAAEASGTSAEDMDRAIEHLSTNLLKIGDGTNEAARALKAFGVTAGDTSTSALSKIADAFAKMPDGVQKTAAAIAIFGKEAGPQLIPLLNKGSDAIKEMNAEAVKLGLVLDQNAQKSVQNLKDSLDLLKKQSEGMANQFVVGLVPGLQAAVAWVEELKKSGADFRSWGAVVGEGIMRATMGLALLTAATKEAILFTQALIALKFKPTDAIAAVKQAFEESKKIYPEMITQLETIRRTFEQATAAAKPFVGPLPEAAKNTTDLSNRTAELAKAADEAATAFWKFKWDEWAKQQAAFEKITLDTTVAMEDQKQIAVGQAAALAAGATEMDAATRKLLDLRNKQTDALVQFTEHEGDAATNMQIWLGMLDDVEGKYDAASVATRRFAQAQIDAQNKVDEGKPPKIENELDILTKGYEQFFNTLSSGSANAADAFKRAIESIIAQLLKLWATRYVLQAFGLAPAGGGGGGAGHQAMGAAFDHGARVFAAGGVVSVPTHFALGGGAVGLMGEAGPEAILPLQRTSSGALGVAASGGGWNVTVHNYAASAAVSARRNGAGDLEILVNEVRAAIATDFRRGGSDVSRAAEAAYGLSRGARAAF